MNFKQLDLNFWQDYESEFLIGKCNFAAYELLKKNESKILLIGGEKCGKKHLLSNLKLQDTSLIYFLDKMNDAEIIKIYDEFKFVEKKIIWVKTDGKGVFSKDVESRMNSLVCAKIDEISEDIFEKLLIQKITKIGGVINDELLKYILIRLPISFIALDNFVSYIKQNSKISYSIVKAFFEKLD